MVSRAFWASLHTQREREEAWKALYGWGNRDPSLPHPITTPNEAKRIYARKLYMKSRSLRAQARRAWLAASRGGYCQMQRMLLHRPTLHLDHVCNERISDYRFLRLWEFNHVVPRSEKGGQFLISGSDCATRAWSAVRAHCEQDTLLLCRECHWIITEFDRAVNIRYQQELNSYLDSPPLPPARNHHQ